MPLPGFTALQPLSTRRLAAARLGGAPANQLNMTMQFQQQTNWCWSAVSVSVKLFYTPTASITQCEQANRQLSQTTCCGAGGPGVCNIPWYLNEALTGLGNFVSWNNGTTSLADVIAQIGLSRPIGCRIGWFGGGGHFVAVVGYFVASDDPALQFLLIEDPIYGTSVYTYHEFATAYRGGTWTTSYLTKA